MAQHMMIWRKMPFFCLFSSKVTKDETAEEYLKLSKMSMEQAKMMTSLKKISSISTKIYHRQCKYLAKKLRVAVEIARCAHFLYLEPLLHAGHEVSSPEYMAIELEIFKLLYVLAKEVENFIQICCKDAWIQAALTLSNVSEHISSIAFNLEVWTLLYFESKSKKLIARVRRGFSLTEVDGIFKAEVKIVKEKALQDMEALLVTLDSMRCTRKSTSTEYQLAVFLLDRLDRLKMIPYGGLLGSSMSSQLSGTIFGSLKQMGIMGKGSAATVYKALWLGGEVAMKTFYGPNNPDFKKEVSALRGLSHPNVVSLLWSTMDKRKCSIFMELMDGDLHSLMQVRLEGHAEYQESPFGILEAVDIMLQIGGGVLYLHEMKIVHRDLKSMNILVRRVRASELEIEYVQAKVTDFGLSKTKERSMTYSNQTLNLGTTRWMAPEMIKSWNATSETEKSDGEAMAINYPFKCDVYSFGMVCYEILTGDIPFSSICSLTDVKKMVLGGGRPKLPDGCPVLLKTLIERCWSQDASQRPCFSEICAELRHIKCLLLMSCLYSIPLPNDLGALKSGHVGCSNQYIEPLEENVCAIEEVAAATPIGSVQGGPDDHSWRSTTFDLINDLLAIPLNIDTPKSAPSQP